MSEDAMPGKFDGAPRFAEYLWELVTNGGIGEDRDEEGTIVTYIIIAPEDVELYPELNVGGRWRLWEDEQGFVHCEYARGTPKED